MDGDVSVEAVDVVADTEASSEVVDTSDMTSVEVVAVEGGADIADAELSVASTEPNYAVISQQLPEEELYGDTGLAESDIVSGSGQISIPVIKQTSSDKAKAYVANILGVPQESNVAEILKGIYKSRQATEETKQVTTAPEMPVITVAPPPIAPLIDDELKF